MARVEAHKASVHFCMLDFEGFASLWPGCPGSSSHRRTCVASAPGPSRPRESGNNPPMGEIGEISQIAAASNYRLDHMLMIFLLPLRFTKTLLLGTGGNFPKPLTSKPVTSGGMHVSSGFLSLDLLVFSPQS